MKHLAVTFALASALLLSGCSAYYDLAYDQQHVEWETETPDQFPVLTAVGYAPIAEQPGDSQQHKDLAASIQSVLEKALVNLISKTIDETKCKIVCILTIIIILGLQ